MSNSETDIWNNTTPTVELLNHSAKLLTGFPQSFQPNQLSNFLKTRFRRRPWVARPLSGPVCRRAEPRMGVVMSCDVKLHTPC